MVEDVTSIFAQPDLASARRGRPIGILGDVDVIAYTADSRVMGRLPDGAFPRGLDRVAELRELSIMGASTWLLGADRPSGRDTVTLRAAELFAFELVDRADEPARLRRLRLGQVLELGLGPYTVQGALRVRPGRDAVAAFERSAGLVVLRDAWIEYPVANARRRRLANQLVVNRDHARAFGLATDLDPDAGDYQGRLTALLRDVQRRVQP
jgi:hypothetical protein